MWKERNRSVVAIKAGELGRKKGNNLSGKLRFCMIKQVVEMSVPVAKMKCWIGGDFFDCEKIRNSG